MWRDTLVIIGSRTGIMRQTITLTNDGLLSVVPKGIRFSAILM